MKFKRLALRVGVVVVLVTMLGGCIVLPYGRGGHRHYSDSDRGSWQHDGDRRDGRRR